jgi:hypothetical protein
MPYSRDHWNIFRTFYRSIGNKQTRFLSLQCHTQRNFIHLIFAIWFWWTENKVCRENKIFYHLGP